MWVMANVVLKASWRDRPNEGGRHLAENKVAPLFLFVIHRRKFLITYPVPAYMTAGSSRKAITSIKREIEHPGPPNPGNAFFGPKPCVPGQGLIEATLLPTHETGPIAIPGFSYYLQN